MVDEKKLPDGYKLTEVGVIPEDWELVPIGDIFKFKNGLNKAKQFFGEGTPIVNYMDVYKNRGIRFKDIRGKVTLSSNELANYNVQKGDVFFTRTSETPDEIGITSVLLDEPQNTTFSGFILRARSVADVLDIDYKKYCFSADIVRKEIISKCTYTTRALTNGRVLSKVNILVPPKPEQKAIAEALSDIDNLIQSLENLIDKKKKIKQGAMQQLLTGKKRLPEFDGEWEVKKLGEIATVSMGQSPSSQYYNSNMKGLPLIQGNADIDKRRSIIRIYTTQITKRCSKGDIIMTVRAPVGAIAKASTDSCLGRGVCSINFKNDYLYYFLISIEDKWSQMSKGSTFDSISASDVLALDVSLPVLKDEQKAIAQVLSDMDLEIEALEEKLEKYKTIKQGMMQELLTGRIRLI